MGHKDPPSGRLVCSLPNKEQPGMSSDKEMEGHLESVTAELGLAVRSLTRSRGECWSRVPGTVPGPGCGQRAHREKRLLLDLSVWGDRGQKPRRWGKASCGGRGGRQLQG